MSARFVSTTRLGNIIQMISLARQSGILRAMRGQGPTRELGQIRFMDGQPISALLGQVTGQAALNVLMNWGECLYAFDEGPQIDANERDTAWSSGGGPGSPLPERSDGSWPAYGYGTSSPASSSTWPYPGMSPTSGASQPPSGPPGSMPPSMPPGYGPMPSSPALPATQSEDPLADLNALIARRPPGAAPAIATMPNLSVTQPELLNSIPVRTALSEHVEQLPLDRRERMVLLLIDGQRTVADLMRLVRRSQQEVYAVLHHLRLLGLIDMRQ
jgi:hypothetical protein